MSKLLTVALSLFFLAGCAASSGGGHVVGNSVTSDSASKVAGGEGCGCSAEAGHKHDGKDCACGTSCGCSTAGAKDHKHDGKACSCGAKCACGSKDKKSGAKDKKKKDCGCSAAHASH